MEPTRLELALPFCLLIVSAAHANYVEVHFTAEITETFDSERQVGETVTGSYKYDLEPPNPTRNFGTGWRSENYDSAYPASIIVDGVQLLGLAPRTQAKTKLWKYIRFSPTNDPDEILINSIHIDSTGFPSAGAPQTRFRIDLKYESKRLGVTGLAKLESLSDMTIANVEVYSTAINEAQQTELLKFRAKITQVALIEHAQKPEILFLKLPGAETAIHAYGKLERSTDLTNWEVEENKTLPLATGSFTAVFYRISVDESP